MQDLSQIFLAQLMAATKGMNLSAEEQRTLKWIAGWDKYTVDNVASIIAKARESGRASAAD